MLSDRQPQMGYVFGKEMLNALPSLGKMLFTAEPRAPLADGSTSFQTPASDTYPTDRRLNAYPAQAWFGRGITRADITATALTGRNHQNWIANAVCSVDEHINAYPRTNCLVSSDVAIGKKPIIWLVT